MTRRTCPACARRYGGLIDGDCPVCAGVGSLSLGPPALASNEPSAIARAVEIYLESAGLSALRLDAPERRERIEAAVRELQIAGVLAMSGDTAYYPREWPSGPIAESVAEIRAIRLTRALGIIVTPTVLSGLAAGNVIPLSAARRRGDPWPRASANGSRSALLRVCDAIDPLGDNVAALQIRRDSAEIRAQILAEAAPLAARHRKNPRRIPA